MGLAAAAAYVAVVVHATAGVQCPARQLGPCAKVHAMLMTARSGGTQPLLAAPMRAGIASPLVRLAATAPR